VPATWELVEAVGRGAALALQRALGGRNVYVPTGPDPEHLIAQSVGLEKMAFFCERWGGQTTWIGKDLLLVERNHQLVASAEAGECAESIAQRFGITSRCVRQVLQTHCVGWPESVRVVD
jgi:Mor family transcriptional regulator